MVSAVIAQKYKVSSIVEGVRFIDSRAVSCRY
jgi:hypothetical protein